MPGKGKGKGGKNRRRAKNAGDEEKREIILKEEGQEYAQVKKMLGNGRLEGDCFDGKTRLCHIRGKMRKKVWINTGDIILIGTRSFQDDKADVILKYTADEARRLKADGELPDNTEINKSDVRTLSVSLSLLPCRVPSYTGCVHSSLFLLGIECRMEEDVWEWISLCVFTNDSRLIAM
jgi:translation initiation factor 1A